MVKKIYMNTWMVPKNKRKLISVIDILQLFIIANESKEWNGNRNLQRIFEVMLEKEKLKAKGAPYDPNSGGARTYQAQLSCLGLIFFDNKSDNKVYRPTLAGKAILEGKAPLEIIQNQLLKLQYPSEYSMRKGVSINPDFKIRPFLFILKLLMDDKIKYLTKKEIARFVIVYGKTDNSLNEVKNMILNYRLNKEDDNLLLKSFMEDTISTRAKKHTYEERIVYLEDKANIFINYLESTNMILRPEVKNKIELNLEIKEKIVNFEKKNIKLQDYNGDNYIFQRKFGLDLEHSKDTRKFENGSITDATIKKRLILREFYQLASKKLIFEITEEIIKEIATKLLVSDNDVSKVLIEVNPDGLNYFEEEFITMSKNGILNCQEFEKSTNEIFEKIFHYSSKHIGQKRTEGIIKGGNPDIMVYSKGKKYCAIIDTKAISNYSLPHNDYSKMLHTYIPNYKKVFSQFFDVSEKNISLGYFLYVCNSLSKNFGKELRKLVNESNINGSGISARTLIELCRKVKTGKVNNTNLIELFSQNKEITLMDVLKYENKLY